MHVFLLQHPSPHAWHVAFATRQQDPFRHWLPLPWQGQTLPHPLQLFGSDERLTQTPPQFANPWLQLPSLQVPSWHVPVPLGKLQTFPQPPQLLRSDWVSTHCPLQPCVG